MALPPLHHPLLGKVFQITITFHASILIVHATVPLYVKILLGVGPEWKYMEIFQRHSKHFAFWNIWNLKTALPAWMPALFLVRFRSYQAHFQPFLLPSGKLEHPTFEFKRYTHTPLWHNCSAPNEKRDRNEQSLYPFSAFASPWNPEASTEIIFTSWRAVCISYHHCLHAGLEHGLH